VRFHTWPCELGIEPETVKGKVQSIFSASENFACPVKFFAKDSAANLTGARDM
jgi:hypothetical protein